MKREPAIFREQTRPIPRALLKQLLELSTPPAPVPVSVVYAIRIRGSR